MDPSPNQNLTDGLIRPPGSVHPSGGHQVLHGPLTAAHQLASTGNPPAVLDALRRPAAPPNWPPSPHRTADRAADRRRSMRGSLPRPSGARDLAADYLRIATTGLYDTARYRSPVRGPAGRAGRRGVGRPHPARRPGPHRERHLARPRRLLHPVPATPEPAAKRSSPTGAKPSPTSPPSRPRNPPRPLSVTPPQASHHHTGGHHRSSIKINNEPAEHRPSTNGSAPGGPRSACSSTPGTPTGPASANAGCCARWVRPR